METDPMDTDPPVVRAASEICDDLEYPTHTTVADFTDSIRTLIVMLADALRDGPTWRERAKAVVGDYLERLEDGRIEDI